MSPCGGVEACARIAIRLDVLIGFLTPGPRARTADAGLASCDQGSGAVLAAMMSDKRHHDKASLGCLGALSNRAF